MEIDLEKRLKEICKYLVVKLKGNQGENGNAIIDRDLIKLLHISLDDYKDSIVNEGLVSKELVGALFYTCSRFYIQSKYSNNSEDLLKEFDKLNTKLLKVFFI
ncbi:hypothetical protein [Bacillus sp. FJAT-28004]|uniref:hypothetical protein n=1 Tax=Bacillus sp. FJAT-28004 TaxID=1679165 RepID=UPI0006B522F6|nr:hypothetical protein [Bacillus sp. FJAT-28004]